MEPHLAGSDRFYTRQEAARARLAHLEEILVKLAYVASVDAFQTWMYTSEHAVSSQARDEAWLAIRSQFEPVVNWDGLEAERTARWYRQTHIFQYPLYYVEYAIAQLAALQVWIYSLEDPDDALARYMRALRLGATVSVKEMYATANVDLVFDAPRVASIIDVLTRTIHSLRAAVDAGSRGTRESEARSRRHNVSAP